MADICDIYTLAGLTFNAAAPADTYVISEITGLDGAPIRAPVDDRPQTDGGIVFPNFLGPRRITFEGFFGVRSVDYGADPSGYVVALNTLEAAMLTALEGIRNSDGTLAWTGSSITVRHDSPCLTSQGQRGSAFERRFIFGLVAANPTIA
jgi:hypothetical protein